MRQQCAPPSCDVDETSSSHPEWPLVMLRRRVVFDRFCSHRQAVNWRFMRAVCPQHGIAPGCLGVCARAERAVQVCDKQYKSIVEIEEHLSSYDHHHRKRLKEMKQAELARTRSKRERQEAKRQAKEDARLRQQCASVL